MAKPTTTTALAVISSSELKADAKQLALLQNSVVAQFRRLHQMREEEALRGLLLGLTLHRVKASLPHGEFGKWAKTHATFGERWVNYLMKLALVFIDKAKATKPELLACPGDQAELALEGMEGEQRRFTAKARKFVGKLNLSELLDAHDIKGGKKLGSAREAGEAPAEPTPEERALQTAEELGAWLTQGRQMLITENVCQHLSADQIRSVADSLNALRTDFRSGLGDLLKKATA